MLHVTSLASLANRIGVVAAFVLVAAAVSDAQVSFAPAGNYPTGPAPGSIAVGDFNGDAALDLAIGNLEGENVTILLGTGTGSFGPRIDVFAGRSPQTIVTADFNEDGELDLAVGVFDLVAILLGTGSGSFTSPNYFAAGATPSSLVVADINEDGNHDLVVGQRQQSHVPILLGTGTGAFAAPINTPGLVFKARSVAVADFNNDGNLDVAAGDWYILLNQNQVAVTLGNGAGGFGPPSHFTAGRQPEDLIAADFNADGNQDLAVAVSSGGIYILLGTGTGSFQPATSFPAGSLPFFLAVGDATGDGHLDLAVANLGMGDVTSLLVGNGAGSFAAPLNFPVGNRSGSIAMRDFNNDGRLDLAVTNEDDNTVSVLLNQGPAPPETLTISKTGSGSGQVSSNPPGITCGNDCSEAYPVNMAVTLTAMTIGSSYFAGWSGGGCSGSGSCVVTMDAGKTVTATFQASSFSFIDENLVGQVLVRAVHVLELRQAINALRAQNGLSDFAFTDSSLTPGATLVRAVHITELRTALNAVYQAEGRTEPVYTDPLLIQRQTPIKRDHILQIRVAVRAIE